MMGHCWNGIRCSLPLRGCLLTTQTKGGTMPLGERLMVVHMAQEAALDFFETYLLGSCSCTMFDSTAGMGGTQRGTAHRIGFPTKDRKRIPVASPTMNLIHHHSGGGLESKLLLAGKENGVQARNCETQSGFALGPTTDDEWRQSLGHCSRVQSPCC